MLLFDILVHLVSYSAMTDLLSSPTPALSTLLLDLNLNMNLNPETTMHLDINYVKYKQPYTFV